MTQQFAALAEQYAKGLWDESEHPRGQPENAGEFVAKSKGKQPSWIDQGDEDAGFSLKRDKVTKPKGEQFENLGGKQVKLFETGGEPGQMNLFQDAGVPDELLPKHLRSNAADPAARTEAAAAKPQPPVSESPKPMPRPKLPEREGWHPGGIYEIPNVVLDHGGTVKYLGNHEGNAYIGYADYDYGTNPKKWYSAAKMPIESVKHFFNDLSGKADIPQTDNPLLEAVRQGKAEVLGKGDDGVAFGVGDKVVKMSTTVPFQPFNPGHLTPQEAADEIAQDYVTHQLLYKAGVPGVPPMQLAKAGDKAFLIGERYEIPDKFTPEQLEQVRQSIDAMHQAGWTVNDRIQVGLDKNGSVWHFDLGKAGKSTREDYRRDDIADLKRLYQESGVEWPLQPKEDLEDWDSLSEMYVPDEGQTNPSDKLDKWRRHAVEANEARKKWLGQLKTPEEQQALNDKFRRQISAIGYDPAEFFDEGEADEPLGEPTPLEAKGYLDRFHKWAHDWSRTAPEKRKHVEATRGNNARKSYIANLPDADKAAVNAQFHAGLQKAGLDPADYLRPDEMPGYQPPAPAPEPDPRETFTLKKPPKGRKPREETRQKTLFAKQYAKEGDEQHHVAPQGPKWVRLGNAPVQIDGDGRIIKGCPGLIGRRIDELHESQDERAAQQEQAEDAGWTSAKSDRARETWEEFKGQHPDHQKFIGLVRHGGKFHTFGDDAKKLQQHLGIGDGDTAEFDEDKLQPHMERMVEAGHRMAVLDRSEDGQPDLDSEKDPEAQQAVKEAHEDLAEQSPAHDHAAAVQSLLNMGPQLKREVGFSITPDGQRINAVSEGAGHVNYDERVRGSHSYHTHPSYSPFSAQDLNVAQENGLASSTVVAADGGVYTVSGLTPDLDKWLVQADMPQQFTADNGWGAVRHLQLEDLASRGVLDYQAQVGPHLQEELGEIPDLEDVKAAIEQHHDALGLPWRKESGDVPQFDAEGNQIEQSPTSDRQPPTSDRQEPPMVQPSEPEWRQSLARQPSWHVPYGQMTSWDDANKYIDDTYRHSGLSSRTSPVEGMEIKPGQWKVDKQLNGSYGHTIDQLQWLDPHTLKIAEEDYTTGVNFEGRGDDARRYAEWMKQGKVPPPITVLETEDGNLKVVDGHRRLAAAKWAGQKIPAWVSPIAETGKFDANGKPIMTAMTYELAMKQALKEGQPVPPEVLAHEQQRIEAEVNRLKPLAEKHKGSSYSETYNDNIDYLNRLNAATGKPPVDAPKFFSKWGALGHIMDTNPPEQIASGKVNRYDWADKFMSDEPQGYTTAHVHPRALHFPPGLDEEKAKRFAQQDPSTAPMPVIDSNQKLQLRAHYDDQGGYGLAHHFVLDGKHRVRAAQLRGDKSLQAIIPTHLAEDMRARSYHHELRDFADQVAQGKGGQIVGEHHSPAYGSSFRMKQADGGEREYSAPQLERIAQHRGHKFQFAPAKTTASQPEALQDRQPSENPAATQGDSIQRVTNDEWLNGNWDMAHAGLAPERTMAKIADGMKGIEGREYAIREHSPGKWQLISRKPQQAEKPATQQRFEPASYDHYREVLKRNADMRLARPGEKPEDTASYNWRDDEGSERRRRKAFERRNVHLADVPLAALNINPGEVNESRQARLTEAGGTTDPIMVGVNRMNGGNDKRLSLSVDDGNNRAAFALKGGNSHIPTFLHGDPEDIAQARAALQSGDLSQFHVEDWSLGKKGAGDAAVPLSGDTQADGGASPGEPPAGLGPVTAGDSDAPEDSRGADTGDQSDAGATAELRLRDDSPGSDQEPGNTGAAAYQPETQREHWYGMHNRPIGHATVPKGFANVEKHPAFRHGAVSYPRPLTDTEMYDFELTPIRHDDDIPDVAKNVAGELGDYVGEYLKPENAKLLDDRLKHPGMRQILGHVDLDKVKAELAKQAQGANDGESPAGNDAPGDAGAVRADDTNPEPAAPDDAGDQAGHNPEPGNTPGNVQPGDQDLADNWNRLTQEQPATSASDDEIALALEFAGHLHGHHTKAQEAGHITPEQMRSLHDMIDGHVARLQQEQERRRAGNPGQAGSTPHPRGVAPHQPAGDTPQRSVPERHATAGEHLGRAPKPVRSLLESLHKLRDARRTGSVATSELTPEYAREMYDHIRGLRNVGDQFGDVHDLSDELGHGAIGYASPAGNVAMIPPQFKGQDWQVRYTLPHDSQLPPGIVGDQGQAPGTTGGQPAASQAVPAPAQPARKTRIRPQKRSFNPNSNLGRAIIAAVGDNPKDQEGFHDLVKSIWEEEHRAAQDRNSAFRELLAQFGFNGRHEIDRFVRSINRFEDPDQFVKGVRREDMPKAGEMSGRRPKKIPQRDETGKHFDQMVEMAQNYYPELLSAYEGGGGSFTSDPEYALFQRLKMGLEKPPEPHDDEIIGKALEYVSGYKRSQDEHERRMAEDPEYRQQQEEEQERRRIAVDEFSRRGWKLRYAKWARSTLARWRRYGRQLTLQWGDEQERQHPRDQGGKWTTKGGEGGGGRHPDDDKGELSHEQMAEIAARHGHDYHTALRRIKAMPRAWKQAVDDMRARDARQSEADRMEAIQQDWKQNGVRSKAFKNWFGDWENDPQNASKVVDEKGEPSKQSEIGGEASKVVGDDGRPKMVYHGTGSGEFHAFEKRWGAATAGNQADNLLYGPGFYFTESKSIASDYSQIAPVKFSGDMETLKRVSLAAAAYMMENHPTDMDAKRMDRAAKRAQSMTAAEVSNPQTQEQINDIQLLKTWLPTRVVQSLWTSQAQPHVFQVYLNIRQPFDAEKGVPTEILNTLTPEQRERCERPVREAQQSIAEAQKYIEQGRNMLRQMKAEHDRSSDPKVRADLLQSKKEYEYSINSKHQLIERMQKVVNRGAPYALVAEQMGGKSQLNEALKGLGYDGITHIGGMIMGKVPHKVWIAFEPNQIKSADNQGTFDPNDPRVRYDKNDDGVFTPHERKALSAIRYCRQRYGADWYRYARQLGFTFNEDEHPRAKETVTIGQTQYKGGEFIPKDQVDKATPAEAEKVEVVDKDTGEAKPLAEQPSEQSPSSDITPEEQAKYDDHVKLMTENKLTPRSKDEWLGYYREHQKKLAARAKPVEATPPAAEPPDHVAEDVLNGKAEVPPEQVPPSLKDIAAKNSPEHEPPPQSANVQMAMLKSQQSLFDAGLMTEPPSDEQKAVVAAESTIEKGITDFGEKIGGARKDTAKPTGPRGKRVKDEDEEEGEESPAWRKRYKVFENKKTGKFQIFDVKQTGRWGNLRLACNMDFNTPEEAERYVPIVEVARNHRVGANGGTAEQPNYSIYREVSRYKHPIVKDGFASRDEAMKYMATHPEEIIGKRLRITDAMIHPALDYLERTGPTHRKSDAKPEDFQNTFGFRGVEFGKWNNQSERQLILNHAYDSMMDLANSLNLPPRAISLNGELALAFGARGKGMSGHAAHYERDYGVINLTKVQGAGNLAHEWMHALDHYLGRKSGMASSEKVLNELGDKVFKVSDDKSRDYQSHGFGYKATNLRPELKAAYENVIDKLKNKSVTYVEDKSLYERIHEKSSKELETFVKQLKDSFTRDHSGEKYPRYKGKRALPAPPEIQKEVEELTDKILAGDIGEPVYIDQDRMSFHKLPKNIARLSELHKQHRGNRGFYKDKSGRLSGPIADVAAYASKKKNSDQLLAEAKALKEKEKKVRTDYFTHAQKMDRATAKDYWSEPHEMAARAFEAYVYDHLKGNGGRNDFLSYEKHNNHGMMRLLGIKPYPETEERAAINEAFANLANVLRPSDFGLSDASRPSGSVTAPPAYTPPPKAEPKNEVLEKGDATFDVVKPGTEESVSNHHSLKEAVKAAGGSGYHDDQGQTVSVDEETPEESSARADRWLADVSQGVSSLRDQLAKGEITQAQYDTAVAEVRGRSIDDPRYATPKQTPQPTKHWDQQGFEAFKKEYLSHFKEMMKYKPDQIGSGEYANKMAEMSDAKPDWVEQIENENEPKAEAADTREPWELSPEEWKAKSPVKPDSTPVFDDRWAKKIREAYGHPNKWKALQAEFAREAGDIMGGAQQQFLHNARQYMQTGQIPVVTGIPLTPENTKAINEHDATHRKSVENALREGKPVSKANMEKYGLRGVLSRDALTMSAADFVAKYQPRGFDEDYLKFKHQTAVERAPFEGKEVSDAAKASYQPQEPTTDKSPELKAHPPAGAKPAPRKPERELSDQEEFHRDFSEGSTPSPARAKAQERRQQVDQAAQEAPAAADLPYEVATAKRRHVSPKPRYVLSFDRGAQWAIQNHGEKASTGDTPEAMNKMHDLHNDAVNRAKDAAAQGDPDKKAFWEGVGDQLGIMHRHVSDKAWAKRDAQTSTEGERVQAAGGTTPPKTGDKSSENRGQPAAKPGTTPWHHEPDIFGDGSTGKYTSPDGKHQILAGSDGQFELQERMAGGAVVQSLGKFDSLEAAQAATQPTQIDTSGVSEEFDPAKHGGIEPLRQLREKIRSGEVPIDEYKKQYAFWKKHGDAFKADLQKRYNAQQLERAAGRGTKAKNAKAIYDDLLLGAFYHGSMSSYGMDGPEAALDRHVAEQTDEKLAEHRAKEAADKAKGQAAIDNPQTLPDFHEAIRHHGGYAKLPQELKERYDDLHATQRREGDKSRKATVTAFRGGSEATGNVGIVEGWHQKHQKPTWTVTIEKRLGDQWDDVAARARQLGGTYVNSVIAKRYNATPGIQFMSKEAAERFAEVLGGKQVDRSDILDERHIASMDNASERLKALATLSRQKAEQAINQPRLANTARRADMAASAEASARAEKARAETLERIADGLGTGELKHLTGIRQRTHLDALDAALQRARWDQYQKATKEHGHIPWEDHFAKPITPEDINGVTYPYPKMWASDLNRHIDQFADVPGLKNLARSLKKTADVSPYKKKLAGFATSGGTALMGNQLEGLPIVMPKDKAIRVHASTDPQLLRGKHPIAHTADGGKTWGTTPEIAVNAALVKGNDLDLIKPPEDQMLTIKDDITIGQLKKAVSKLRRHSDPRLRNLADNLKGHLEDYDRLQAADITSLPELRAALREYVPYKQKQDKEDPVKAKERALVGRKIPGFFPTPRQLAERLVATADIQPGHSVLEPSAGKGDLLDVIREQHPDADAVGIEPVSDLRDILTAKGHQVADDRDFLGHAGQYDRIVMNPPFENGQDAAHVQHAYSQLKPGGKMVAIMSAGPFYRSHKRDQEFRDWIDSVGADVEDLPEGSFAGSDAFRQTGVNTKLVVLHKPGSTE